VIRPPQFWRHRARSVWPCLLTPAAAVVAGVTARRVARPGWRAPVPVICCGNVTVGGAGKTTLALDLGRRLQTRGVAVHFLLRGYGGDARGPRRVSPGEAASRVGDEAVLLAAVAPSWIGGDRAASARAAIRERAEVLVLDDGLQNPTLAKDLSLLVVDGATGFGNGRVLPAGPLREPVAAAAARCHAVVLIGDDATDALGALPPRLPVLRARLQPAPDIAGLAGRRVLAFAGLALPEKFFSGLAQAGVEVVTERPFPDHHPYTEAELRALLEEAATLGATPVTTPKDAVRLPGGLRRCVTVVGVNLLWNDPDMVERLLDRILTSAMPGSAGP
jgi:tetraacyldisaccharide 4'-kinase